MDNCNTKRVYTFLKLDFVFLCCVHGVHCVFYHQPTEEFSVNEEDFDIKSRLTQSKQFFFKYRNSSLIQYKLGLYVFEKYFLGFCHFLMQSSKKHIFVFRSFTSDFADSMSIISKTTKWWVIKKIKSQLCLYWLRHSWREQPPKLFLLVFWA